MWVQREKLFSRWKERFIVITEDFLQCFKKGSAQLSEMGPFLFKVDFALAQTNRRIKRHISDPLERHPVRVPGGQTWLPDSGVGDREGGQPAGEEI